MLRTVFLGQPDVWALTLAPADEVVGAIALIPAPKRNHPGARMIGYWLARPLWGQGYMTEAARAVLAYAFEPQRLSLVTATCYPHNAGSRGMLLNVGFRPEGHAARRRTKLSGRGVRPAMLLPDTRRL